MDPVFLLWNDKTIIPDKCLHDSGHYRQFVQRYLGVDVDELGKLLSSSDLPCIPRDAKEVLYRGRQISRTNFFLYDDSDGKGMPVYCYTGFQWASTKFYQPVERFPAVHAILKKLNASMRFSSKQIEYQKDNREGPNNNPELRTVGFNHVVGTKYADGKDGIGYHMDKTRSFHEGSPIVLLSFGVDREFHVKCNQTDKVDRFVMQKGDMFILGWNTNKMFKHALVPVSQESEIVREPERGSDIGVRTSLCFRSIKQRETSHSRKRKIEKSNEKRIAEEKKKNARNIRIGSKPKGN